MNQRARQRQRVSTPQSRKQVKIITLICLLIPILIIGSAYITGNALTETTMEQALAIKHDVSAGDIEIRHSPWGIFNRTVNYRVNGKLESARCSSSVISRPGCTN